MKSLSKRQVSHSWRGWREAIRTLKWSLLFLEPEASLAEINTLLNPPAEPYDLLLNFLWGNNGRTKNHSQGGVTRRCWQFHLAAISSGHWECNSYLRFTIKIDLNRPGECLFENGPSPKSRSGFGRLNWDRTKGKSF